MATKKELRIGCQIHTIKKWLERGEAIAKRNNAAEIIEEYRLYIELAAKLYGTEGSDDAKEEPPNV